MSALNLRVRHAERTDPEIPFYHSSPAQDQITQEVDLLTQRSLKSIKHLVGPHKKTLFKELAVEVLRTAGLGVLASYLIFQTPDKDDALAGNKQMATAFLIAPLFASIFSNSISIIGRKTSLLFFPLFVTPGIKRSAEYRKQFEEKKAFYSPSMQEFLEQSITTYTYILEHHNFNLKELATAIEEVLRLPTHPKPLERKNPKVREILTNYSPDIKRKIAHVVSDICSHSHHENPTKRITPIMLVGPPGTGKTFLVRQIAGALDLPLCEVKISDYRSINGNNMWSNDPEMGVILDTLLKSSLENPENPPANVILFIDEPDKVLEKGKQDTFTHPAGNAVNTFLHTILEAGTTEFSLPRYFNASHSIRHIIVMLGVNRNFSDVLGEDAAKALESRIRTIDFGEGFDLTRKKPIVAKWIEETNHELGRDLISQEDATIKRIIQKDEEHKLKGVRILLDVVDQYIQSIANKEEIAYFIDEEPMPFNVDEAYAKQLPKKKETPPSDWVAF